jgi:hypothetical protein
VDPPAMSIVIYTLGIGLLYLADVLDSPGYLGI